MSSNLMGDFRRDISFQVSQPGGGRIRLTATMRDVYHDILLEAVVNGDNLCIEGLRAEFTRCPEQACPRAAERLQRLVGVIIGRGLNRRIAEALGGGEGCGNLRLMLSGLLPLAINVTAAQGFDDEQAMMESIRGKLHGSCAGYPEDDTELV